MLSSNISSTCPHNMVNFGPLAAEIGLLVWGTPANFNWLRVLASLLHWSTNALMEVNQTLHDVCPSPGLLRYTYIFGGSCPLTEFCQTQNRVCIQVLRSPIAVTLVHGSWPVGISKTLRCGIFTRQGGHPVRHWAVELPSLR